MSNHAATLQSAFNKTATVLDFARTAANRLYWLDDNYIFYSWAAPRLRDVAISGLYWAPVTLIDITLWLIDITSQFMVRNAQTIALHSFAQAQAPLELLALCPAVVPLALPSMATAPVFPSPVMQWIATPKALDDADPVLTHRRRAVPMAFSQFLDHDHSIRGWLTAELLLVLAPVPDKTPVVTTPKSHKTKATGKQTTAAKPPRKRSPKTATAAAQ